MNEKNYILMKFHWSLFIRVQLTIGLDNGLALNRRQAIIWTNADPVHWYIHAAIGGDELTMHESFNILEIILDKDLMNLQ